MKSTTTFNNRKIFFVLTFLLGTIGLFAQNTIFNNNRIRVGSGVQNSINASGNMEQPFYYNGSSWQQLTYFNFPLDIRWGNGGDGTNDWNINGTLIENPVLTNQTFDYSGFTVTNAGTGEGYGEIITTGQITIGGQLFEVQNTYELLQPEGYISINVKITNISATPASNIRLWVGTRDDFVGGTDGPLKERGNLVDEQFELITNQADQAKAIKISTPQEAILFFSASDRAYSTINFCCSFANAANQDPATNVITQGGDGSYALYVKMNDLGIGESDDFTWYYGAGTLPQIDEIIASIASAAGAFQNITQNSADYGATVSENGIGYWMLVPEGSTAPTAVEIESGTNYGGTSIISSGNTPIVADVESIINLNGLQPMTTYDFYFVTEYFDGTAFVYTDILDGSFTTLTIPTPGGVATDLGLWLKADDGATNTGDGTAVSGWFDNSYTGNNAISTGQDAEFQLDITDADKHFNFNPVVDFNESGAPDNYDLGSSLIGFESGASSVFAVYKGGNAWDGFLAGNNSPGKYIFGANVNVPFVALHKSNTGNILTNTNYDPANGQSILGYTHDTSTVSVYANGTTTSGAMQPLTPHTELFLSHPSYPLDGDLAEIIAYEGAVTSMEALQIQSYLALKYGITLDQTLATDYLASDGTTKMWDATTAATYNNDIAGIGRDDDSALNQKQSKSVNANGIVAMGLTTIEASNTANSATFVNDKNFMVWANNDGANTWTATGAPTDYQILGKQWQIQEVGTVGAVTVQFDVADTDFDVPATFFNSPYYIIYDSDNDDDLSDETPVALSNTTGDIWETALAIDFANGMEFSLATFAVQPECVAEVDFDDPNDLTDIFNSDGSPEFTSSATGGITNSGSVSVPLGSNDIWTTKQGYSVTGAGDVFTFSAYFKVAVNNGYGNLGFSDADTNTGDSIGQPSTGLGVNFHGGGGAFVNNGTTTNLSWPPDLVLGNWYFMTYEVTYQGANTFDQKFQIWNTDVSGVLGSMKTEEIQNGVVNTDLGTASTVHAFFSSAGSRMSDIDLFKVELGGNASCVLEGVPVVASNPVSFGSGTTATSGGEVLDDRGEAVTARGVVWSTSPNPTIAENTTSDGTGLGTYGSTLTGLVEGETYYVRSYAQNTNGIGYGTEIEFFNGPNPGGVATDLALWLKADEGVTGTSPVTAWADMSPNNNGYNAEPGATASFTANAFNYNPTINIAGDLFNRLSDETYPTGEAYFVFTQSTTASYSLLARDVNMAISGEAWNNTNSMGVSVLSVGSLPESGDYASTVPAPNTIAIARYSITAGGPNFEIMAEFNGSRNTASLNTSPTNGYTDRYLPSETIGQGLQGNISEVIMYSANNAASSRIQIESYLALKYGITLDQTTATDYLASDGTTKMWDATGASTYNKDIAGIGRDDAQALNQKVSKSVNADALVSFALDNDFATVNNDAARTTDHTADLSFMTWANNDTDDTFAWTETGAPATRQILDRAWKVSETGTVGTVYLSIPDNSSAATTKLPAESTAVYLLTDTDDDFSDATETVLTLNGDQWELPSGVDLADGDFFTFATHIPVAPGGVSTGLAFWLDPTTGMSTTVDGAVIDSWTDRTNANVFDIAGGFRPMYRSLTHNYHPSVEFSGGQVLNVLPSLMSNGASAEIDFFAVASADAITTFDGIVAAGDANVGDEIFSLSVGGSGVFRSSSHDGGVAGSQVFDLGTPFIGYGSATDVHPTGNDIYRAGLNGGALEINNGSEFHIGTGVTRIGEGGLNGEFFDGHIPEVIGYNRNVTATERQQIESYLAIKYGISLDQTTATDYLASDGTTKMWDATTAATYNNDIAGIGRDDDSALNQKQSKSVNADGIVAMGLGDIAATNAANTATFAADKNYMVWGNDDTSTDFSTVINGTSLIRMTRVWAIQETGTVGTVKVRIPQASFTGTTPTLLRSTDSTFDNTDEQIALTDDGNGNYEGTMDFASGDYFSFAQIAPTAPGGVAANLTLWLKADNGVTDPGTAITAWLDQSGNSNNLTTVNGDPDLQGNILNFNPVVDFDGNDYFDIALTQDPNAALEMIVVSESNLGGGSNQILLSAGIERALLYNTTGVMRSAIGTSSMDSNTSFATNEYNIHQFSHDTSNGTHYLNGLTDGTSSIIPNAPSNPNWRVGARNAGLQTLNGSIAEIIVYNTNLGAIELQRIDSYLALKYGITLDQTTATDYLASDGTTKMWDATAAVAYNNDIAGIGRDDAQALNQKQSKSVNANGIVAMGLASIEASNMANTATFANDKNFMVWANNDGAATWTATGAPTAYQILGKQWQIQETGTVGAVTVQFDVADVDFDVADLVSGTSYYLIYDANDNDDLSDETPIALNNSGGAIWETSSAIDFAAGMEFTLATEGGFDVSGIVYYDEDGSGVLDVLETSRLQDVTITLFTDVDNSDDFSTGDTVFGSATSSAATTGAYTFVAVPPGEYVIVVDAADSALNNDVNNGSLTYGATSAKEIAITVASAALTNQNFGFDQALVALAIDQTLINESGSLPSFTDVTATVIPTTEFTTTVSLTLGGTAIASDYTISTTNISISPNTSSETARITAVTDAIVEVDETVSVDINTVTNATEDGVQQVSTTINEDHIDYIISYADNNSNPVPTETNFTNTGITGVTAANIVEVNAAIDALIGTDVDTQAEIQAVVDGVNAGNVIELYADNNSNPVPVEADFTALGVTGVTAANIAEVNAAIDALVGTDVDTQAEVQAIVDAVNVSIGILAQIGTEGDSPNVVPSAVTVAELGTIVPALTNLISGNEAGYQAYIDANPNTFSDPATAAEVQAMITSVNAAQDLLTAIGIDEEDGVATSTNATEAQLNDIVGVSGALAANEGDYQAYIDANASNFSNPATAAEVQTMIDSVNAAQDLLTAIGIDEEDGAATTTNATAVQLNDIVGVSGALAANEGDYQDYIDANAGNFSSPATAAEVQAMIDSVNAAQDLLTAIGIDEEDGAATTTNATAAQLNNIVGVSGALAANEGDYQDYIDANASNFSSPATAAEVQAMITSVNAAQDLLTAIGVDEEDGAATSTNATEAQLNDIVGVSGALAANEGDYQDYIDANASNFSSPATAAEVQAMIDSVNAAQDLLTAIGIDEEDGAATTTNATAAQLNNIVGVSGALAANEGDYQDYIDANAANFSSPATAAEVQAMIDSVNAAQDLLIAIGVDEEDGAATSTNATEAQLNDIVGVSGALAANEGDYQDYIDANAGNFSSPATAAEVQAMITSVNAAQDLLTAIGIDEEDGFATSTNATEAQLNDIVGVSGALAANEGDYQDYIDANASNFSSPATAAEVQAMITSVNAAQDLLTAIGIDEEDGGDTSTNATEAQLNDIVGVSGALAANEGDYQAYIDANAGNFSSPATAAEVQAMIDSVNAAQDLLTAIGIDEEDGVATSTNATEAQLNDIVGVSGALAANEGDYQDYIDANAANFSSPATAAEVQAMIDSVNAAQDLLTAIGVDEEDGAATSTNATEAQLNDIVGVSGALAANEGYYQDYIDANAGNFSSPATAAEVQTMIDAVNLSEDILAQIGSEGDDPDNVPSVVTAEQLNSITGIMDVNPANEMEYQEYIDVHPELFSDPATEDEIQAMIVAVNDSESVLAQIGNEGDNPDAITSVITVDELNNITGIMGVDAMHETLYQEYIDANPEAFGSPATAEQVQAMVTEVNEIAGIVGNSNDPADGNPSETDLLAVGVTEVNPEYLDAYEEAIANADPAPNSLEELQIIIDAVNQVEDSINAALAEILEDSNAADGEDNANGISVTVDQLGEIPGVENIVTDNEEAYQIAISNETNFSNPPTIEEIQVVIDAVNTLIELIARADESANGNLTLSELSNVGITDLDPLREALYEEAIANANPQPQSVEELQAIIDQVNGTPLKVLSAEAFTPNGDGINDGWMIDGILDYPNNVVRVYNRNGHEVFAAQGYQNDWNATFDGNRQKLPPGSYYYVIDLGDGSAPRNGWIFINY